MAKQITIPEFVYHGTNSKFEVFDNAFTGQGNDQLGSGFYFTDSYNYAIRFGNNVMKCKINIKNPIIIYGDNLNEVTLTHRQIVKLIKQAPDIFDENETPIWDFIDLSTEVLDDALIEQIAIKYKGQPLYYVEHDFFRDDCVAFREACRDVLHKDGIIAITSDNTTYVCWFPEQIQYIETITNEHLNRGVKMDIKSINEALQSFIEEEANEVHFATEEAKALWENEITGQLSDGNWENTKPLDHYKFWTSAKVIVDGQVGYKANTSNPRKTSYNLNALIPYVGDRMRAIVSAVKLGKDPSLANYLIDFLPEMKNPTEGDYWVKKSEAVKAEFGEDLDSMAEQLLEMTSNKDLKVVLSEIKTMFTTKL